MRETQAIIERVRQVADHLQQLELSANAALGQLQPGQSLFAWPADTAGWDPYLREQWIPVAVEPGSLTVELPAGRTYAPGQVISLLSPVGRPIPRRPNARHVLLIADGMQPTPFVLLAHQLTADGVAVTLVLGAEALRYPLELLPAEVEVLHGDTDWKWPDQVETLSWADQVLALAPWQIHDDVYASLYHVIAQLRHHDVPDNYVCGLFYRRLACGTGACQACQVSGQGGTWLACTDGPALDLREIVFR
jgi:NAD(P)H-flavin reductase